MSDSSLPWPLTRKRASEVSRLYSLDYHYDVWAREGAGEGPNSPPLLPIPERTKVLHRGSVPDVSEISRIRRWRQTSQVFPREDGHTRYEPQPRGHANEARFLENFPRAYVPPRGPADYENAPLQEEDDDLLIVDWDWLGYTHDWVQRYTSADPQNVFEPVMTFRTPPSEDGMAHLVLNDAGEYVLAGYGSGSVPESSSMISPKEGDLPPQNSASSGLSLAVLHTGSRRRRRFVLENPSDSGSFPARQRSRQDIPEATRGRRRFALEDLSASGNARESRPATESNGLSRENPSSRAQHESGDQIPGGAWLFHFHSNQGQAGEERARRLHFYDGRESQGSEFRPSVVRDEGLRATLMPNFLQVLQRKLGEHFENVTNALELWFSTKVTWFAVMAICITILLILRGLMMGYPFMVAMWLKDLGKEVVCSFQALLGSWVLGLFDAYGEIEFKYDKC